jgi:hypothetical protein
MRSSSPVLRVLNTPLLSAKLSAGGGSEAADAG